jgi:transposase
VRRLAVLKTWVDLTDDELIQLAVEYQEGATVYDLAERFKIHRTTVSAHLHRQGARMRKRGMTEQQTVEAARLYRQGWWSLARLGGHFRVDGTAVWRDLRQLGVPMRKPYERGSGPSG